MYISTRRCCRIKRGPDTHTKAGVIVMSQASAYFTLGDLDDQHDQKKIKRELDTLPGVRSVSISDSSGRVAVDFDTTAVQPDQIRKLLEKMGYQITEFKTDDGIR